jgi:hypothetical protein
LQVSPLINYSFPPLIVVSVSANALVETWTANIRRNLVVVSTSAYRVDYLPWTCADCRLSILQGDTIMMTTFLPLLASILYILQTLFICNNLLWLCSYICIVHLIYWLSASCLKRYYSEKSRKPEHKDTKSLLHAQAVRSSNGCEVTTVSRWHWILRQYCHQPLLTSCLLLRW